MGELLERRGERGLAQHLRRRPAACRRPGRSARSPARPSARRRRRRSARARLRATGVPSPAWRMAWPSSTSSGSVPPSALRRLERQHPAADRAGHRERRQRPARRDRRRSRDRAPAARARPPGPPPSARARAPTARAPARSRRRRCRSCADRPPRSTPPSRPSPRAHCRPRRAPRGRPPPRPRAARQTTPRRCPAVWRSMIRSQPARSRAARSSASGVGSRPRKAV